MYFGLLPLSAYPFLLVGFWIVMIVALALCLVYVVGSTRGKRAAQMWTDACVGTFLLGSMADVVWAVFSGQWRSFMLQFGLGPLSDMVMLAVFLIGIMWFMAIRYTQGLKN